MTAAMDEHPLTLEPGIYPDLSVDAYNALPYLRQSVLKRVIEGEPYSLPPRHAKDIFDGLSEDKESNALRLGRAEHTWIIEGEEEFRRRYLTAAAKCEKLTADGNPCKHSPKFLIDELWVCGQHAPKGFEQSLEFITEADIARIKAMGEAVRSHEVNQFFRRPGFAEYSLIYDVPVKVTLKQCRLCSALESLVRINNGFRCRICGKKSEAPGVQTELVQLRQKVRLDKFAASANGRPPLIIDLKRMQYGEGHRERREWTIREYGWDVQAAQYTEAVQVLFGCREVDFVWVFVEEKRPHDVVWIPASPETLRIGRNKLLRARERWARCTAADHWPGYCEGPQEFGGLPEWYIRKYEKEHGDDTGAYASDKEST